MEMRFSELASEQERLESQSITLGGWLFVDDKCHLAEDRDASVRGEAVEFEDSEVIALRLMEKIPPMGGGKYLYAERAEVTGTLVYSRGMIAIRSLQRCIVFSEDGKPIVLVENQI